MLLLLIKRATIYWLLIKCRCSSINFISYNFIQSSQELPLCPILHIGSLKEKEVKLLDPGHTVAKPRFKLRLPGPGACYTSPPHCMVPTLFILCLRELGQLLLGQISFVVIILSATWVLTLESAILGFQLYLCYLLAVSSCSRYLSGLVFSFIIYKKVYFTELFWELIEIIGVKYL